MDELSWSVPRGCDGERVVDHVKEHLAVVATREVGPLLARRAVAHGEGVADINATVRAGDVLRVDAVALAELDARRRTTPPADRPLAIVHEDDDVLVVDKPAGRHVHPMGPYRDDTVLGAVLWHAGARPQRPWARFRPYPGHRLDRATSGLIAFLKHRTMQDAFRRLLDDRRVERTYHALVEGAVADDEGLIDAPLGPDPGSPYRQAVVAERDGGRDARSRWRVLARPSADTTLVEVSLETGRTHQIRVHLASIGHPIAGDALYATDELQAGARPTVTRIALHAARLTFPHPRTGATVTATSLDHRPGRDGP